VISLRVQDSYGIYSQNSDFTINILSPPLVSLQCDEEGKIGDNLLFTTVADDKDGLILSYEWDFDSDGGEIDSVDFSGSGIATHSYNETSSDLDYLVVVKVTDNDGLIAYDKCEVKIDSEELSQTSSDSDSSGGLGSLSEIVTPPVIGGGFALFLVIGGLAYYFMRDEDYSLSETDSYSSTAKGSGFMDSIVPEASPVKDNSTFEEEIIDTTVVECPQCSAQIDVPSISGAQSLECPDCGLEGEIEL